MEKGTKEFCVSCGQLTVHELVKDEQGAGKCARSAEEKSIWGGENCSPVASIKFNFSLLIPYFA